MENKYKKYTFVLEKASDPDYNEMISVKDIRDLLKLIDKFGNALIIDKNRWVEEYKKDKKKFINKYVTEFVKKVKQWEKEKAKYTIMVYDDYIE